MYNSAECIITKTTFNNSCNLLNPLCTIIYEMNEEIKLGIEYLKQELEPLKKRYKLTTKNDEIYIKIKGETKKEEIKTYKHAKYLLNKTPLKISWIPNQKAFLVDLYDKEKIIQPIQEGYIETELVKPNELQQLLLRYANDKINMQEPILAKWDLYHYTIIDGNRRYDAQKHEKTIYIKTTKSSNIIRDAIQINKRNYNTLEKIILILTYKFAQKIFNVSDETLEKYKIFYDALPNPRQFLTLKEPVETAYYVYLHQQYFPNENPPPINENTVKTIREKIFNKLKTNKPPIDRVIEEKMENNIIEIAREYIILKDPFTKETTKKINLILPLLGHGFF
jgi:hypothetical protein